MSADPSTVRLRCRCGTVSGTAHHVSPRGGTRAICYCDDCQAFARFLATDVLDADGGTEVYQMPPAHVRIEAGFDQLECLRLSPRGLHRFYTKCCNTPVGNMVGLSMPFVGLAAAFMELPDDSAARDALLGRRAGVHGRFALNGLPAGAHPSASIGTIARTFGRIALSWITRKHLPSPFFAPDGSVRTPVTVLSLEARQRLTAPAATSPDDAPERPRLYREPFDHLVFYAVEDTVVEPAPDHPKLVIAPPHSDILVADYAPTLVELSLDDMLQEIDDTLATDLPDDRRAALHDVRQWVVEQGQPYILYQLEPASMAGNTTARQIGQW